MITPRFNVTLATQEDNHSQFVLEPLESGYGHTLANALRRVLLTSIPGHAITGVKISGVDHQFSHLPGVTEDVVEIMLNLKEIRVRSVHEDASTLKLSAKGGVVTAADIVCPSGVEIVNPQQHLATLESNAKLEMELTVSAGVGYSAAEEREASDILGYLQLDALYSPIVKVSYSVEETRVGRRTDFDRVILNIWTNGTVEAKAALDEAANILIAHFQQVISPENVLEKPETPVMKQGDEISRLTIEELDLPTRIANALRKGGYNSVGDLMKANQGQVALVKNLGGKSIDIVREALEKVGATFKDVAGQE